MTPTECVKLTRLVKAIAPAQRFDEYTSDAWHTLLSDTEFSDATEAVRRIGRRQPFIAPADIIGEVRAIRRDRLDRADATFVYDGDPDDPVEYKRQLLEHRRGIGDGVEPPLAPPQIVSVPPAAIANTFKRVPPRERTDIPEPTPQPARPAYSAESLALAEREWAEACAAARNPDTAVGGQP